MLKTCYSPIAQYTYTMYLSSHLLHYDLESPDPKQVPCNIMKIKAIPVGAFEVNCWIISNYNRDAIIIDPGADAPLIEATIQKMRLNIKGYLLTHGHMDHLSALADVSTKYPAPIRIHPADATWAFSSANQMPPYYPEPPPPPEGLLHPDLTESTGNQMAGFTFDVIETPGHSPGSVCLYFSQQATLFTGDTIVAGSTGRTDFPGGSASDLQQSLKRLLELPPKTAICSGHGPASTLENELQTNPFLQDTL